MRLGGRGPARREGDRSCRLTLADRWILSRFANACKDVTRNLKTYRFAEAATGGVPLRVERVLRLVPGDGEAALGARRPRRRLTPEQRDDLRTARWVSWRVLDGILRLLHPFMPFVTEELWQAIPHEGETLATAAWPKAKKAWFDADSEREVSFLQEIVVAVRNLRVESKIPPGKPVPVVVRGDRAQLDLLKKLESQVKPLARIETLTLSRDGARPPVAASAVVQGAEVFLPLDGLVDLDEERARLAREAQKLLTDLEQVKKKLRNQDFLRKAKPEIVSKENERLAQLEETLDKLKRAQQSLSSVRE